MEEETVTEEWNSMEIDKLFEGINYFKPEEFKQPEKMQRKLLEMLDYARALANTPFRITSSYRTPKENGIFGGVRGSAHTKGLAVDISCYSSDKRMKIVKSALRAGFRRIGIAKTYIHLDCDDEKPDEVIWLY